MINSYNFVITPRDIDFSRKSTLVSLCDYILECAGCDADRIGYGMRDLINHSHAWVLSRMAVEVHRYPLQYEKFSIETWIESVERAYTCRSFVIRDISDNVLAKASSYWSMIDFNTRKIQDLSAYPEYLKQIDATRVDIKPRRIHNITSEDIYYHKVAYTDIDFNGHANTTKQLGWMLNTLPLSLFETSYINKLDVNFMHESIYGKNLAIMNQKNGDEYIFSIYDNNLSLCNAAISFK